MVQSITLPISKKTIDVTKRMSRKEVITIREKTGDLMAAINNPDDPKSTAAIIAKTAEQDDLIAETLLAHTSVTQAELDGMDYYESLFAFDQLFRICTEPPKN